MLLRDYRTSKMITLAAIHQLYHSKNSAPRSTATFDRALIYEQSFDSTGLIFAGRELTLAWLLPHDYFQLQHRPARIWLRYRWSRPEIFVISKPRFKLQLLFTTTVKTTKAVGLILPFIELLFIS